MTSLYQKKWKIDIFSHRRERVHGEMAFSCLTETVQNLWKRSLGVITDFNGSAGFPDTNTVCVSILVIGNNHCFDDFEFSYLFKLIFAFIYLYLCVCLVKLYILPIFYGSRWLANPGICFNLYRHAVWCMELSLCS